MTTIISPYMVRSGEQHHITEEYVSVPPALTITDETGAMWTLGFQTPSHPDEIPRGEFGFNVLRNGLETGEVASRIERCKNKIRIFTRSGWKWMNSQATDSITTVYGIGARMKGDTQLNEELEVRVYFERPFGHQQYNRPLVSFVFNSLTGGLSDLRKPAPLQCLPGQWLIATVSSIVSVEVMAFLGNKTLRAIPIRQLD